jgi:hypothetical protein
LAAVKGTNAFFVGPLALGASEPETYAMMLAGLGLLGAMARRKQATN